MLDTFVYNLSSKKIIELCKLFFINRENKIYYINFKYKDINYLKKCYYNSKIILDFYVYFKSLPIDLQLNDNYFEAIIYHYNTIYQDRHIFIKNI
jgi:hypothetical protein